MAGGEVYRRELTDAEKVLQFAMVGDYTNTVREYLDEAAEAFGKVQVVLNELEYIVRGDVFRGLCIHHADPNCPTCTAPGEWLKDPDAGDEDADEE